MTTDQRDTRRDYEHAELRRADLPEDPLVLFSAWLARAGEAQLKDATAMTLATSNAAGEPSARIVLLKHYDADGLVWYTDYGSHKGLELDANPSATLLFYWREFERQVRISGAVVKVAREVSQAYFDSRPLDSRLSAAASAQSAVIEDRAALEAKVADLQARYPNGDVPMPDNWGGYCLAPVEYEFWQGRVGRLHDRFRYRREGDAWRIERLQP